MGTTRIWLLVGVVAVSLAIWKLRGVGHGDLKVTGRGTSVRIDTISHGERVELGDHVAPTGRTIFEFTAEWCPGCRQLAPQLEALVERSSDLHLRKIDISRWESEVAAQHSVRSIPRLVLYESDGDLIADGTREVLEELQRR